MSGITAMQRFTAGSAALGRWSTLFISASIAISIAFDNLLLTIALLAWLVGAKYRNKLLMARNNPVYRAALLRTWC